MPHAMQLQKLYLDEMGEQMFAHYGLKREVERS